MEGRECLMAVSGRPPPPADRTEWTPRSGVGGHAGRIVDVTRDDIVALVEACHAGALPLERHQYCMWHKYPCPSKYAEQVYRSLGVADNHQLPSAADVLARLSYYDGALVVIVELFGSGPDLLDTYDRVRADFDTQCGRVNDAVGVFVEFGAR